MKKHGAAKTRKSATRRRRPVNDLTARKAPTGGADGSVLFIKDGPAATPLNSAIPSGVNVAMADGSVRFVR